MSTSSPTIPGKQRTFRRRASDRLVLSPTFTNERHIVKSRSLQDFPVDKSPIFRCPLSRTVRLLRFEDGDGRQIEGRSFSPFGRRSRSVEAADEAVTVKPAAAVIRNHRDTPGRRPVQRDKIRRGCRKPHTASQQLPRSKAPTKPGTGRCRRERRYRGNGADARDPPRSGGVSCRGSFDIK